MRHRARALRRRYGRHAAPFLRWESNPGGGTFAITKSGTIYSVLLDIHKRKWVLTDSNGFLGSAIRKSDAKKIAQQIENRGS